jgi:hypothetical protein
VCFTVLSTAKEVIQVETTEKTMQQIYVDRMREKAAAHDALASWIERVSERSTFMDDKEFLSLITPYTYNSDFTVDLTVKDTVWNEKTQEYDYPIDEAATEVNVTKFKRACGGILTKEYNDDVVTYTKVTAHYTIVGKVSREVVCKPLKVEKVWHEPYTSKGYWSEHVVEWDCGNDTGDE